MACLIKKNFNHIYLLCVCVCAHAHMHADVQVKGQFTLVGSLLPCKTHRSNRLSGLSSSTLIHLPALAVTFKEGIYRDQGEGSVRSAHCASIHVRNLGMCLESQYWGSRDNWIHGALWLASLAGSSSSRISKRFCSTSIKWRAIKGDTQSQHLAPTDTRTQVCQWTYKHTHTHAKNTYTNTETKRNIL